jgi:predicted ABC-type ATPase
MQHPIVVFVRGVPGSGKSYLVSALQATLDPEHTIVLDPDAIDFDSPAYHEHLAAQRAEGVDEKLDAYRFLRAQAYEAIADHKLIIWNQPFTDLDIFRKMTGRLLDRAAECNTTLPILLVEVELDPGLARQRVQDRKASGGHGPSDNTLEHRMQAYGTAVGQGYDIVTVRGDDDVSVSVAIVMDAIAKLA